MNFVLQAKVILLVIVALGSLDAARIRIRYSGGSRYFGGSRYSYSYSYTYSQSNDGNAHKWRSLYRYHLDRSYLPGYRTTFRIAGPGMGGLTVNKHVMVQEGSVYITKDLHHRLYTSTKELIAESVENFALCSGRIYLNPRDRTYQYKPENVNISGVGKNGTYNFFLCPSDLFGGVFEEHSKYCCGPHDYQMCCSVDDFNEQMASPESPSVLLIMLIFPMTIAFFGICVFCIWSYRKCRESPSQGVSYPRRAPTTTVNTQAFVLVGKPWYPINA